MNDMENIKKILSDYEVPYDHNDWIKLEKDLPKLPGMSSLAKLLLVATAVIISIAGIYFLTKQISKDKTDDTASEIVNNSSNNTNTVGIFDYTLNDDINKSDNLNNNKIISNNNSIVVNEENDNNLSLENESQQTITENKTINEINNNEIKEETQDDNFVENILIPDLSKCAFKVEVINNCIPSKIIFTAENVPSNCEIIWNTDDNYRVYGNRAEHSYLETGRYNPLVSIIFNNFVIKTEKLQEIEINQPSVIKINFENSDNLYYFTCNNKEELSILWSIDNQQFSEKDISYNFNLSGEYNIMLSAVNEFGCKSEVVEKINITIQHIYFVPEAFIPNSNGVNSEFGPIGENMDFASFKMVIVDVNGNSVFESFSPEYIWNGRINNIGEEAKPGFYFWEIKTMDIFGNVQTKKGRVNLIRN